MLYISEALEEIKRLEIENAELKQQISNIPNRDKIIEVLGNFANKLNLELLDRNVTMQIRRIDIEQIVNEIRPAPQREKRTISGIDIIQQWMLELFMQ